MRQEYCAGGGNEIDIKECLADSVLVVSQSPSPRLRRRRAMWDLQAVSALAAPPHPPLSIGSIYPINKRYRHTFYLLIRTRQNGVRGENLESEIRKDAARENTKGAPWRIQTDTDLRDYLGFIISEKWRAARDPIRENDTLPRMKRGESIGELSSL